MRRIPRLSVASVRSKIVVGALIGLLAASIGSFLRTTHAIDAMERRAVDSRTVAYLGSRPPDPRIVLAVVEETDLQRLNSLQIPWPWDLMTTSLAFEWMAEAGVAAVAVDVLQFDRGLGRDEVTVGPGVELQKYEAIEKETPSLMAANDAVRARGSLVLSTQLVRGADVTDPKALALRRPVFERLLALLPPLAVATDFERTTVMLPVVRLLSHASQVGFANADPDDDGILRRATPVARVGDRIVPSLSFATAIEATKDVSATSRRLRIGGAEQDLDARGGFYVNFRAKLGAYPRVAPADMVLAGGELEAWRAAGRKGPMPTVGSAVPEAVRGKIVVWGVNPPGVKDVVAAPIADNYPGPEYQAAILDNLLNGDGRVAADRSANLLVLFALAGLLGVLGGLTLPKGVYAAIWAVLTATFVFVAYRIFKGGTSLDVVTPLLALGGTYAGVVAFRLLTEGRRNKWLEGTFGRFLAPSVMYYRIRDRLQI